MLSSPEFEQDCLPHYAQIEGLCRRMLGSGRAADAAQETFARALRSYPTLNDRQAARGWLFSIANRYCLDLLRQREVVAVEQLPEPVEELNQESQLLSQELLRGVQPRSRSLLILRHCLQLSYQEISSVLDIPVNQVGVALQRARQEALRYAHERGMTDALR